MEKLHVKIDRDAIKERQILEMRRLCNKIDEQGNECSKNGILPNRFWNDNLSKIIIPKLQELVGDENLYNYAAFHFFIFSTPPEGLVFDLPGDTIVNFAKELVIKLRRANETRKSEL